MKFFKKRKKFQSPKNRLKPFLSILKSFPNHLEVEIGSFPAWYVDIRNFQIFT